MNNIKVALYILSSLFMGVSTFSYVSAYGENIIIDAGAGCKIQEKVIEVEPDCTDPFFQDMLHKAADTNVPDTFEVVPAPTYDTYPASEDPEFPLHVIFDEPIDRGLDAPQESAKVEAYNKKIQEEKTVQYRAPVKKETAPVPQEKNNEEQVKSVKLKEVVTDLDVQDTVEQEQMDTTLDDNHASAGIPSTQVLTVSYVLDKHLWELLFVGCILFLLFSLLFI